MRQRKLYRLLDELNVSELRELGKYISIRFGNDSSAMRFVVHLSSKDVDISKYDELVSQIFSGENKRKIQYQLDTLTLFTEDFLILKQLSVDKTERKLLLHKVFLERGHFELALRLEKRILKSLMRNISHSMQSGLRLFLLYYQIYFSKSQEKKKRGNVILNTALKIIDYYHSNVTTFMHAELINLKRLKVGGALGIESDEISDKLEKQSYNISLYNDLIEKEDTEKFKELFLRLPQFLTGRPSVFGLVCYQNLIDFATSSYATGNKGIKDYIFQLYQLGIKEKLYNEKGYIPGKNFLNIVNYMCALRSAQSAKEYLEENNNSVHPSERLDCQSLSLANIALYNKNFEDTLTYVSFVSSNSIYFTLRVRWLKLISHTFLKSDNVSDYMDASYQFIRLHKKELSSKTTSISLHLLILCRKIIAEKPKKEIVDYIEHNYAIAMRSWFEKNYIV